jgi:hypothetical protein
MAGPPEVVAKIEETLATAARCSTSETAQNYEALAQALQDLADLARRSCESHVDYGSLVRKLRAGTILSTEEMATLRLLIVGDADYYLKYDEEFDRCKTELTKILGEIERFKASEFSVDALMHLSVLSKEASELLIVTQHYLGSRERVRMFENSTKTAIDLDSGRILAAVVEDMVAHRR